MKQLVRIRIPPYAQSNAKMNVNDNDNSQRKRNPHKHTHTHIDISAQRMVYFGDSQNFEMRDESDFYIGGEDCLVRE